MLGDVTDSKDEHNAELVNRVVREVDKLRKIVARIVILMGNHDFLRAGHMFFDFLNALEGVEVITSPQEDKDLRGESAYFLPYSKDPVKDWAGLDFSHYRYLFMHQTVKGAKTSNGQIMDGEELPPLNAHKVYSGDIHVPQIIGDVEYVGSPYAVHFGDSFKPRCVLIERDLRAVDLHFDTLSRVTIQAADLDALMQQLCVLRPGDQVKVRMVLDASDRHDWKRIKRKVVDLTTAAGLHLHAVELIAVKTAPVGSLARTARAGLDSRDSLRRFVDAEELGGDAFDAAMDIMESP